MAVSVSPVFGQAKINTETASFLNLPYSAENAALGECGTTIISEQAPMYNPGALGLYYLDRQASLSLILPHDMLNNFTLKNGSVGIRIPSSLLFGDSRNHVLALGYNRVSLSTDWIPVIIYEPGTVPDSVPAFRGDERAQFVTIGFGYSGAMQIGIGASYIEIDERYSDLKASAKTISLGLIAKRPMLLGGDDSRQSFYQITPTFGLAYLYATGSMTVLGTDYDLPKRFNWGFSVEIARRVKNRTPLALELMIERQSKPGGYHNDFFHLGSELGLFETFYLRIGRTEDDGHYHTTYGGAFSLSGLANLITHNGRGDSSNRNRSILGRLDFVYSYGNHNYVPFNEKAYHQFSISLK